MRNIKRPLVCIMLILLIPTALAFELKEDEALVVISVHGVKKMQLRDYNSKNKFAATGRYDVVVKKVKAGDYYLSSVMSWYDNVGASKFPKPKKENMTFSIEVGSVTYLGDWFFQEGGALGGVIALAFQGIEYSDKTLMKAAKKKPVIKHYPLRVVTENGKVHRFTWP